MIDGQQGQPLELWCQQHWQRRVAADPDVNGILATVMLTQMFMSELAQAYPQGTNLSAVSKVDGPGCCYFASRPMRMPDSLDTVTQRTDLRQQQRLLTELDVLIHACRNSVGERIEHAAIGTHYALLEAFLQKVRYDLLGLRAPALPEGADVRTFYYEMVYRCTGEQREVRKPAPEEPAPPPVQPSCGFELTFLLEDGCEGPRRPGVDVKNATERNWITPSGRKILPVPFIAMACPRCQPAPKPAEPPYNRGGYELSGPVLAHLDWSRDRRISRIENVRQLEHLKPTQALFLYPADPNEPQACGVPIWPAETRPDRVELQARWLAEKPRGLRGGRHG